MRSDRRDLALLAVEKTRMPMMVSDPRLPDDPIVMANQAFLDLIGYSAEEVIGRNCRFLQGPDTDPAAIALIRRQLAGGSDFEIELLNYRKDGSNFWNALHVSPLRDDNGSIIYHFASQQDVTRTRQAAAIEAAELALLREVDHRAKNALALVQGIVRLSRADNSADYATAVQGRVDALAIAHGLLADAHWQPLPLGTLVTALLRNMGVVHVECCGPTLSLNAGQVQPLSLVLHELLDNAGRHGALSVRQGRVSLEWECGDRELTLTLREQGGPPPAERRTPGFGLTVANAITGRQLGGRLDFDWVPTGLVSRLTLPLTA